MKHAGPDALVQLAPLLERLRLLPGLTERRPGIFYVRSTAFLHFHEDPAGLFADVKLDGRVFERLPLRNAADKARLLRAATEALASQPARASASSRRG